MASAAVTAVKCVFSSATPGSYRSRNDRLTATSIVPSAELPSVAARCDRVRVALDYICDLVEEFMDRDESRPTDIPVRLLDLCVQIDRRGQMPVKQLG